MWSDNTTPDLADAESYRKTAGLQHKSAEIASGWPFFDVQKLRCGKQRNMPAAQFQDNFLSEESNSARYRMHGRPPVS